MAQFVHYSLCDAEGQYVGQTSNSVLGPFDHSVSNNIYNNRTTRKRHLSCDYNDIKLQTTFEHKKIRQSVNGNVNKSNTPSTPYQID